MEPDRSEEPEDRSALLRAFGVAEILLGLPALFLAAATGVGLILGSGRPEEPGAALLLPGLLFNLLFGILFTAEFEARDRSPR